MEKTARRMSPAVNEARSGIVVTPYSEKRISPLLLERETEVEPATSSLGIQTHAGSKSFARFCCEFLNLQPLAESAFSRFVASNEAQTRHVRSLEIGPPTLRVWLRGPHRQTAQGGGSFRRSDDRTFL